jgi:magnesium-transporting ATPase (P-type)
MARAPRRPGTPLLDRPLLVRTVAVAMTLMVVSLGTFELEHERQLANGVSHQLALARGQTAAVTAAVLFQALYLLTCRSLTRPNRALGWWSNPAVYVGILGVLILQVAFVMLPAMHSIFGSARLDLQALAIAFGASLLVFPVTWIEERWRVRGG